MLYDSKHPVLSNLGLVCFLVLRSVSHNLFLFSEFWVSNEPGTSISLATKVSVRHKKTVLLIWQHKYNIYYFICSLAVEAPTMLVRLIESTTTLYREREIKSTSAWTWCMYLQCSKTEIGWILLNNFKHSYVLRNKCSAKTLTIYFFNQRYFLEIF